MAQEKFNSSDRAPIPILLLKTRSLPNDAYDDYFSQTAKPNKSDSSPTFEPHFVPVLEHRIDAEVLSYFGQMMQNGTLRDKYGGMIFTSQRAVEGWADTVKTIEEHNPQASSSSSKTADPFITMQTFIPFPLYSVGPATSRNLHALYSSSRFMHDLNAIIEGEHTGNGANLATFIQQHYNALQTQTWFDYFEAPRLPFIPLLGMSSENYGRKRLEGEDARLKKKPLLFLVGEKRRDVIPKTLMNKANAETSIEVQEVEVYRTEVMSSFGTDLGELIEQINKGANHAVRVVVVFSPQGSDVLLQRIGFLDGNRQITERGCTEWQDDTVQERVRYVVATIGPTTRDFLKTEFGFDAHVCSSRPNPEALRDSIEKFLQARNLWKSLL